MVAVGDEGLGAVDDVVLAFSHCLGLDPLEVGTGAGLGHRDGGHDRAGGHLGEPLLLLLLGAVVQQVVRDDAAVQRGSPAAVTDASLLLDQDRLVEERPASPAILLRDRRAQQPQLAGAGPQLTVDALVVDEPLDVGLDLLLAERAGELAEVVEVLGHPGRTSAGHRASKGCGDSGYSMYRRLRVRNVPALLP